ncbi:hypothetical protein EMCRGX_G018090 [Ephydatia muelleri]
MTQAVITQRSGTSLSRGTSNLLALNVTKMQDLRTYTLFAAPTVFHPLISVALLLKNSHCWIIDKLYQDVVLTSRTQYPDTVGELRTREAALLHIQAVKSKTTEQDKVELRKELFQISYCNFFKPSLAEEWRGLCSGFVHTVKQYMPELLQQKTHLALHLVDSMIKFGPCSAFSAEQFESNVQNYNVHGNRLAPSRDIAYAFLYLATLTIYLSWWK